MHWRGGKRVSPSSPPPALNFFAFSSFSTSSMANSTILSSLTLSSSKILPRLFQLLKECWKVTKISWKGDSLQSHSSYISFFFLYSLFATKFLILTTPCRIPSLGEGSLPRSVVLTLFKGGRGGGGGGGYTHVQNIFCKFVKAFWHKIDTRFLSQQTLMHFSKIPQKMRSMYIFQQKKEKSRMSDIDRRFKGGILPRYWNLSIRNLNNSWLLICGLHKSWTRG